MIWNDAILHLEVKNNKQIELNSFFDGNGKLKLYFLEKIKEIQSWTTLVVTLFPYEVDSLIDDELMRLADDYWIIFCGKTLFKNENDYKRVLTFKKLVK